MENKVQLDTVLKQHKIVHNSCTKIMNLFPIKSRHDIVDQILSSKGELKTLQETLYKITELTKP